MVSKREAPYFGISSLSTNGTRTTVSRLSNMAPVRDVSCGIGKAKTELLVRTGFEFCEASPRGSDRRQRPFGMRRLNATSAKSGRRMPRMIDSARRPDVVAAKVLKAASAEWWTPPRGRI